MMVVTNMRCGHNFFYTTSSYDGCNKYEVWARRLVIPDHPNIHHRQHPGKLVYLRGWNTGQGLLDLGKPRRMYEELQVNDDDD